MTHITMKRFLTPFSLLAMLLLAACGSDDNTEPPAELVAIQPEAAIEEHWSAEPHAGIAQQYLFLEPLWLDGILVTAGREGRIAVVNSSSGEIIRETRLELPLSAGVGGNAELWLVASRDGEVIAIDPASAQVKWKKAVPSEVLASPVVAAGAVIVRTVDGHVLSLDSRDGSLNWSHDKVLPPLTLRGMSKPVLTRDSVIIGQENGRVIALELDSGKLLWDVALSVPRGRSEIQRLVDIDGQAALYGRLLYAVGYQGRVAAIDVTNGQFSWARSFSSETGVSVDDQAVYVTDERGHVWALDRFNGATLWKQDALTARQVTRPVIAGDYLLVGDYAGVLHVLSRADGHFVAREQLGSEGNGIFMPPLFRDGRIIVSLREGGIYALGINSLINTADSGKP